MVSSFCMISEKMNGEITRSWHKLLVSGKGFKGYSQKVPGSVSAWGPATAKVIFLLISTLILSLGVRPSPSGAKKALDGMVLTQETGPRRVPNPRSRLSLDVGTDHFPLEIKLRPKASNLLWRFDGLGLNDINNKNIKHLNPLKNKTNRNKFREIYSDYLFKSLLTSIQIGKRENSKNYKIIHQFKYKIIYFWQTTLKDIISAEVFTAPSPRKGLRTVETSSTMTYIKFSGKFHVSCLPFKTYSCTKLPKRFVYLKKMDGNNKNTMNNHKNYHILNTQTIEHFSSIFLTFMLMLRLLFYKKISYKTQGNCVGDDMMPGLLPDNISKPHNHTWLNSLIFIFMLTYVFGKFLMHQKENSKTAITLRIDDVENAHPLYKREWALTRPLQPHMNCTQYLCNFLMLWPIKYNHTIFKTTHTPKIISDTRPYKLLDPISDNLLQPKFPLLMPLSDSCSGPLFVLMLKNSFVYTDFLNVYMMVFNGGGMLPLKKRDRISHPSGTQNGPFACSCTFFMLFYKLINRESGGDTDPATQRMDIYGNHHTYSTYLCINQIDLHAHAHAQTYFCISHSY